MKRSHLVATAVLAACTTASAADIRPGSVVLLVGENAAICPTINFMIDLAEAYQSGDAIQIESKMLDHRGPCLPSRILRSAQLKVVRTDPATGFIGVRLADTPNGGVQWTLRQFLRPAH